jgi:ribosome biogenesis GTPase
MRYLDEDAIDALSHMEKPAEDDRRLEELGEADTFGARMEGPLARGVVLEVRRGNFLTRMLTPSPVAPASVPAEGATDAGPLPFVPDSSQNTGSQQQTEAARATPLPSVPAESTDTGTPRVTPPKWNVGDILRTIVRGTMQQFDLGLSSLVAPGDDVEMIVPYMAGEKELFQYGLHGVLTKVAPRRNEFRRLHPSGRAIQTLAANVDRILIIGSAAQPDFRPGFVDRVLVCAMACGLPAALILNKTDLGVRESDDELLDVYRELGLLVYKISLVDPTAPAGDYAALQESLAGKRSVLAGHSGVGKSSLLRALDPSLDDYDVRVAEVSTQTGKGTHTTTHARLFPVKLPSGASAEIIDTPGVREFTPADTDRRNLWGWFPEIAALQGQCAFADCTHQVEKGCAVLAAVERGEIHPRRHQSYVRIYQTLPN